MYRVEHSESIAHYRKGKGIVAPRRRGGPVNLYPVNESEFEHTRDAVRDRGFTNNMRPTGLISAFLENRREAEDGPREAAGG